MPSAQSRAHECAGRNAHSRVGSEGDWFEIVRTRRNSTQTPVSFFQRTMSRLSRGVGAVLVWECCQLQISATNLAGSSNRTLTSASDVNRRTMQLLRCNPHASFSLRDATIPGWCRRFDRMHASDGADQKNRTRWQLPREFCRRSRASPGPV
jgi:hypothetical protein